MESRQAQAKIRNYLRDAAGSRSHEPARRFGVQTLFWGHRGQPRARPLAGLRLVLVFDLSITHDRIGSSCHVQQNGLLSHPQDLDAPLRLAAQRKINSSRQQCADNQNISFLHYDKSK